MIIAVLKDQPTAVTQMHFGLCSYSLDIVHALFSSFECMIWLEAYVTLCKMCAFLTNNDVLQSCGMHAFSLPDAYAPVDTEARDQQDGLEPQMLVQLSVVSMQIMDQEVGPKGLDVSDKSGIN